MTYVMRTSSFVGNVIQRRQSPYDGQVFRERAHLSFKSSGSSGLDLCVQDQTCVTKAGKSRSVDAVDNKLSSSDDLPAEDLEETVLSHKISDLGELTTILPTLTAVSKYFFVRQRNSRSRLEITFDLFEAVCRHCEIFDKIRDYALCFGIKGSDVHINPPAMRFFFLPEQRKLVNGALALGFETAYIIRIVEASNRADGMPWSIRQCGIYQKFEGWNTPQTWLFIALSSSLEDQLKLYLSNNNEVLMHNPFEIHFLLFDTAISSWRGCILFFAEAIQKQSDLVFMAQYEVDEFTVIRLEERQYTKKIEDNIMDVATALSFMLKGLDSIVESYRLVRRRSIYEAETFNMESKILDFEDQDILLSGFAQRKQDLQLLYEQAEVLQRKIQSVSILVSNILELDNGNALKNLAVETRKENANIAVLTKKSVQDAATVKILTIITLIYLPLTVVTNLFSTSFIGTSTDEEGPFHITVTPDIWILFAIGVPLTILTVYVWWIFAQKETLGRFPGKWEKIIQRSKVVVTKPKREADPGYHERSSVS